MGAEASREPPPDKYHIQKVKLGGGSFGTVWRSINRETKEVVAMKAINIEGCRQKGLTENDLKREIDMLRESKGCINITQLLDTFQDSTTYYMALEYCEGGDFGDKVKERGRAVEEWEAANWMRQIVNAIAFLHNKNIIHRDIKPDNFLIGGPVGGPEVLKLSDFGLALKLEHRLMSLQQKCGTPAFMAPEQHKLPDSGGYSLPVDVWAAGVCMWVLLHGGVHPFVELERLNISELLPGKPAFEKAGFFSKCKWSQSSQRLCHAMTNPDPRERPTADEVYRNEWFEECRAPAGTQQMTQCSEDAQKQNMALLHDLEKAMAEKDRDEKKIQELEEQIKNNSGPSVVSGFLKNVQAGIQGALEAGGIIQSDTTAITSSNSGSKGVEARDIKFVEPNGPNEAPGATGSADVFRADGTQLLRPGTKVNYAPLAGTNLIPATVLGFNNAQKTYDLDVRNLAPLHYISAPSSASCRWPDGTSITTELIQGNMRIITHGIVCGFHPEEGTYDVDDQQARKIYSRIPANKLRPRTRAHGQPSKYGTMTGTRMGTIAGTQMGTIAGTQMNMTQTQATIAGFEDRRNGRQGRGCFACVRRCLHRKPV
eukprot:GEMP01019956.1.p1 GENE.GEMP01019956.1~~GEMP01019956.1.p1  ORF type:complete len:597 (+),score=85.07 GEMP01019956.1:96-1886(+)